VSAVRSRARIALVGLLCGAAASACDSPTIPGRDNADVYPFELATQPPSVLHWPAGTGIRVFIAGGTDAARSALLRESFDLGAAAWNALAVFGEFALVETADAASADVVLAWSDAALPVATDACAPVLTRAVTTFCLDPVASTPRRLALFPLAQGGGGSVKIVVTVLAAEAIVPATVRRLVAHELGHVLGLAQHSPNPADLMWRTDPTATRPSVRDVATVQVLYHLKADVVP
jgi:hypothetical protein